jgi:hypothetical protein
MTTDNICFYLQNRLIQTSQTGGQQYSDISPFSIPWFAIKSIILSAVIFRVVMRRVTAPFISFYTLNFFVG